MTSKLILIIRTPDGRIQAHDTVFGSDEIHLAADAAGTVLADNGIVTRPISYLFAGAFAGQPLGTIWGHDSGYDFRILKADFTTDGHAITPGLKVITNDLRWGLVEPTQFMNQADPFGPGGIYNDGWYLISHEGGVPYAKFNGDRLGTKEPR